MTPLEAIAEWRKGCSDYGPDAPENCRDCTVGLIDAVEAKLRRAQCVRSLHTHPKLESELSVPEGHVIVDKDVFDFLVNGGRFSNAPSLKEYMELRLAVAAFAMAMAMRLYEKHGEGKRGWDDPEVCSTAFLRERLAASTDPVDVGNFAMMLWARCKACG